MASVYSNHDLQSLREAWAPDLEKARLMAEMQIDAALNIAIEKEMERTDENVLKLAQIIATNWASLGSRPR